MRTRRSGDPGAESPFFIGALVPQTFTTRGILACAHLNYDPTDNRDRNRAALCQRCHMITTPPSIAASAGKTRLTFVLGDLYEGRYPLIG